MSALMNQASHYVDLLDWLVGPVESVSASIATISREIEVEDTAALQLRWCNGALGTMAVTMLTYPKNLEGSITLLGETGTVKIGGPAVNQIEHWAFADESPDDAEVSRPAIRPPACTDSAIRLTTPICWTLCKVRGKPSATAARVCAVWSCLSAPTARREIVALCNYHWNTELVQSPSKSNVLRQPGQGSHPPSTRFLLSGIWAHLSRRRRIQLGLLLVVMLVSGVAELLSLGAVLPFLLVLSDPERLWQQRWCSH